MIPVRYIEMFGGVGGFRLGLECVDNDVDTPYSEWASQHFRNVGHYEWDKYAVKTYNANFGTSERPTDVKAIKPEEMPDFDLLTGGFPCQPFSIAGRKEGFEDVRGTMFFEIARIAQAKRPSLLLIENVRHIINHEGGGHSPPSCGPWMASGMTCNGDCVTLRYLECPRIGNGYTLSDILEDDPDPKYFLSAEMQEKFCQAMIKKGAK